MEAGLPLPLLEQAMVNTQVGEGFFLKRTADASATVAYLVIMTRFLNDAYQETALVARGICDKQSTTGMDCSMAEYVHLVSS